MDSAGVKVLVICMGKPLSLLLARVFLVLLLVLLNLVVVALLLEKLLVECVLECWWQRCC